MNLRVKYSLTVSLAPLFLGLPWWLVGSCCTESPRKGYHTYVGFFETVLSALIYAPLLGCIAYFSWSIIGNRRDRLLCKAPIGNALIGLSIPALAVYSSVFASALFANFVYYFGLRLWEIPEYLRVIQLSTAIWTSTLFLFAVSLLTCVTGLIFGWLKDRGNRSVTPSAGR